MRVRSKLCSGRGGKAGPGRAQAPQRPVAGPGTPPPPYLPPRCPSALFLLSRTLASPGALCDRGALAVAPGPGPECGGAGARCGRAQVRAARAGRGCGGSAGRMRPGLLRRLRRPLPGVLASPARAGGFTAAAWRPLPSRRGSVGGAGRVLHEHTAGPAVRQAGGGSRERRPRLHQLPPPSVCKEAAAVGFR